MSDTSRTCGGCAWFKATHPVTDKMCTCPCSLDCTIIMSTQADTDAEWCSNWRDPSDQAIIDACWQKAAIGIAIEYADVKRLIELLTNRELPKRKACTICNANGKTPSEMQFWYPAETSCLKMVTCWACDGDGYYDLRDSWTVEIFAFDDQTQDCKGELRASHTQLQRKVAERVLRRARRFGDVVLVTHTSGMTLFWNGVESEETWELPKIDRKAASDAH